MKILVKFPSRERPQKFMRALKACIEHAHDPISLHFLFSFDRNDESMWGIADEITPLGISADIHFGFSKSKIDAVNRDLSGYTEPWDILLLLSDDMICEVKGWDTIVKREMQEHFPDGDGMIWHYDGKQGDITTLPIMGHAYYNRDHYVYHPTYFSVWCDQEQTDVAKERGRIVYFPQVLFRHIHPATVTGVIGDDLHTRNELAWFRDKDNYDRRKAKKFAA